MKREINNHIENHLKLISNNLFDISICVEKITSEIKRTLKKELFFLLEMVEVQLIVNIWQLN